MGVLARCLGAAVLVAAVVQPAFAQVQIKHARWGVADARGRVTGPSCNARQQVMQACEGIKNGTFACIRITCQRNHII